MAKLSNALLILSYFLAFSADVLVLCGLASLQRSCHTGDEDVSLYNNICSKSYRFEWWGFALQAVFLILVAINWVKNTRSVGTLMVGTCSTVLAMIFANNFLFAVDAVRGTPDNSPLFSRTTLTFIGFMLVAVGNFLTFLMADCTAATGSCEAKAEAPAAGPTKTPTPAPVATVTV